MTCFNPIKGYRGPTGGFVATLSKSPTKTPMTIPCGQCIGCRMSKSSDFANRMVLECQMHSSSLFCTGTHSDETYPADGCGSVATVQSFIKDVRHAFWRSSDKLGLPRTRIRFHALWEYGPVNWRLHYHFHLFGAWFPDMQPCRKSDAGNVEYSSKIASDLWPHGDFTFAPATPQTCGYSARYSMKKINGAMADSHYLRAHPVTGELVRLTPERALCSTNPGIARGWFDKFEMDCFPKDFLVLDGKKVPVSKYFARQLKGRNAHGSLIVRDDLSPIAAKRKARALEPHQQWNNTPGRLAVREEVLALRVDRLKRNL